MGRKKAVTTVLLLTLAIAWAVTLRPTALGGPATFTTVSGTSMEPTYQHGDLVIARRSTDHEIGDVVVYHVDQELVIHRIVGGDADAYLTQGDNRDRLDPWEPTDAHILGTAWLHVPAMGGVLARASGPGTRALMIAVLAVVLVGPGTAPLRRRRRRNRRRTPMASTPRRPVAPRRRRTISPPRWTGRTTIAAVGVLLVAAPLAALAWSQPADGVQLDHDGRLVQHATFSYTASAQPSLVYPEGVVGPVTVDTAEVAEPTDSLFDAIGPDAEITEVAAPPVPLYRELIDGLTVELDYTAVPTGIAADVVGTMRVEAVATNRDGWAHTTVLHEDERFDGSWDGEVEVPLGTIDATMTRQAELTGQPVANYELVIRATVDVEASVGGRTVEAGLVPELAFGVGGPTLAPASGLVSSDTVHLGRQVAGPTSVTLGPLELTTSPTRGLSTLAIILGVIALGLAAAARTGLLSGDPSVRVRIRYGSLLVTIPPGSRVPGRGVPIGTIRELAKLARAENGVMLHEPFEPRLHRYLVPAGDVVYVHVMAPDEPGDAGAQHLDPEAEHISGDGSLAPPRRVGRP